MTTFVNDQGQWLFAVNIFPCLTCFDRHCCVPLIGHGDYYRIEIFGIEQTPIVVGRQRHVALFFLFEVGTCFCQVLTVQVTDGIHILAEVLQVILRATLVTHSDHADSDSLAGGFSPERSTIALRRNTGEQAGHG